jgi:DNA-binding SARP family transcriptional activator
LAKDGGRRPPFARRFRLALLRGFELATDDVAIPLSSGPQHLLAYLALNERSMRRIHVAGILWPDVSDERAAGNLRSALWRLRLAGLDLVGAERGCLRLAPNVAVDIRELNRLASYLLNPTADMPPLALEDLRFAGELLPGWCDEWVLLERERQRQICLHLLEGLCERWTRAGYYVKAVMAGLAAVTGEPLRESAHRALIRAYLAEGNSAEAVRQYRQYSSILRQELSLEPSDQMTGLLTGLPVTPG